MMDMNNNDFFGDIKKDEFEDENISGSGINYGETPNKSSIKTILIAIGAGAIVAGIFVLLLGPNNNTKPNNYAEIPTISSPSEPIKIIPEDEKLNEVFQNASVYNPTDFDAEAQKLMTDAQQPAEKPASVQKVEPVKLPTPPVKEVKKVETKKPLPPKSIKKTTSQPKQKLIEKETEVKGEVEVSKVSTPTKKIGGIWNVQITSTSSESAAKKEWTNLVAKYPSILKGLDHTVSKTEVNGKIYYRLRVSNLESSATATDICNKLKSNNVPCFVTK